MNAYSDRYTNEIIIVEAYKDFHGVKPRWIRFDTMSDEEIAAMAQELGDASQKAWDDMRANDALIPVAHRHSRGFVWDNPDWAHEPYANPHQAYYQQYAFIMPEATPNNAMALAFARAKK